MHKNLFTKQAHTSKQASKRGSSGITMKDMLRYSQKRVLFQHRDFNKDAHFHDRKAALVSLVFMDSMHGQNGCHLQSEGAVGRARQSRAGQGRAGHNPVPTCSSSLTSLPNGCFGIYLCHIYFYISTSRNHKFL